MPSTSCLTAVATTTATRILDSVRVAHVGGTMRTADQRRTDAALLLTLWAKAAETPVVDAGDKLWQMKLAFLVALDLVDARVQGLNLSFYRWTWGPLSNEVYEAWDDLTASKLVQADEHFVFTRTGLDLAQAFYQEVVCGEPNLLVREAVDRVAGAWHGQPVTARILKHVYDLEIAPCGDESLSPLPIRNIERGVELIEPVPRSEAAGWLTIEPGWLETLALTFNAEARTSLEGAIASFRSGHVIVG